MALDGILLSRIVSQIAPVLPARIQKIYQISNTEVLFQIHGKSGKQQLLVSCHSVYNRLLITKRSLGRISSLTYLSLSTPVKVFLIWIRAMGW